MSDKLPNNQASEEVDLGQLFKAIGNLFDRLYRFIKSIITSIFSVIIYGLKAIIDNFKTIATVVIVLAIAGFAVEKIKPKVYTSSILVRPYFESKYQLLKNINYYNALIDNDDYNKLSEIFEMDKDTIQKVLSFEVDLAFESENAKILKYERFIKSIDSTRAIEITYDDYIENEDVKNNLLQTHPNLRFHCDTTERDRMNLLTPDVLRSLTAPIAYVYKKNKKNIYIYDSLEDFVSEVLTNDDHGIFYIINSGIRIRRIEIDIEKIIGYVYIVIKNVALRIAKRDTQNIDVQLTLDNTHYIQAQLSDPENYRLLHNSMYNIAPDSLDIVEHSLDKDYQDIHLQKLHSYRFLQHNIDLSTDIYLISGTLFYHLIQSQIDQLKGLVADSYLLTTQNKFIPYLLLNHPTLVTKILLANPNTFKRPVRELYSLWLSTTDQRNKIIVNDCTTQKEYRKYLTWLCNGSSTTFENETQIFR